MNLLACLFTANKFVKCDQGRVGWNGLPLAHDALRVNNFTGQHGATVHGKLQNMHQLFAAVHFHVGARRHKVGAALSLLGRSVIEQAPERTNGAISFDGAIVDINNAGIGGSHPLPFGVSRLRSQKHQKQYDRCHAPLNSSKANTFGDWVLKGVCKWVHALYYKVAQPS
jgi:hypothetical protein